MSSGNLAPILTTRLIWILSIYFLTAALSWYRVADKEKAVVTSYIIGNRQRKTFQGYRAYFTSNGKPLRIQFYVKVCMIELKKSSPWKVKRFADQTEPTDLKRFSRSRSGRSLSWPRSLLRRLLELRDLGIVDTKTVRRSSSFGGWLDLATSEESMIFVEYC